MRILFVKTSSLGDVIHQCPAVTDTRRRYPDCKIDWVVEESFSDIVRLHPAVRRVIPVAYRRWRSEILRRSTWSEIRAFDRMLRAEQYDFVIDTQGLLKSAVIASRALGVRHGYDGLSAREPVASRFYDVRHRVPRDGHAVERNRALSAAALGDKPPDGNCEYGLVSDKSSAIQIAAPFCLLLSMTSRPEKLWPEPHWAGIVRALADQSVESVLPWGSEEERLRCLRIIELAGSGIVPRAMSLAELAGLTSRARAVVGVDTGLAHLAVALGAPIVGLYVHTDPALTGLYGVGPHVNLGGPGAVPTLSDAMQALRSLL